MRFKSSTVIDRLSAQRLGLGNRLDLPWSHIISVLVVVSSSLPLLFVLLQAMRLLRVAVIAERASAILMGLGVITINE